MYFSYGTAFSATAKRFFPFVIFKTFTPLLEMTRIFYFNGSFQIEKEKVQVEPMLGFSTKGAVDRILCFCFFSLIFLSSIQCII